MFSDAWASLPRKLDEIDADDGGTNRRITTASAVATDGADELPDGDGGDVEDTDDGPGGVVPRSGSSTVYVDLSTRLYHAREEDAGPDPAAFTRDQAERFSYRACPDCFDGGHGGAGGGRT